MKPGQEVVPLDAPERYVEWLAPVPEGLRVRRRLSAQTDIVHLFATSPGRVARVLASYRPRMKDTAAVWVSWPKKASGVASRIGEDDIRRMALPLGLVDVKVCAVDDVWSALKLVVRRDQRRRG
jgi:hypothetical protein